MTKISMDRTAAILLFVFSVAAILAVGAEARANGPTTGDPEAARIEGAEVKAKEGFVYNEEAGPQYVTGDFTWTVGPMRKGSSATRGIIGAGCGRAWNSSFRAFILPFTWKHVDLHFEYAKNMLSGSNRILTSGDRDFDEFAIMLRVSTTPYTRF